jgi:hypothetical protein
MLLRLTVLTFAFITLSEVLSYGQTTGEERALLPFNATDAMIIQRNILLRDLVESDPRLVKAIVDRSRVQRNNHLIAGLDPKQNPDLVGLDNAAEVNPEWLALLQQAQDEIRGRTPLKKPRTRSPEGSLEFIEMMKKAKEAKEGQQK